MRRLGSMLGVILLLWGCSAPVQKSAFRPETLRIQLRPLGPISQVAVNHVKDLIEDRYQAVVTVAPRELMPRFAYYNARHRWRAPDLVRYLQQTKPAAFDLVVGVTDQDISTTKGQVKDWGIFGWADWASSAAASCRDTESITRRCSVTC